MGVELSLRPEFVEQWIEKREGYPVAGANAPSNGKPVIVTAMFLKRRPSSHLAATGEGMSPAQQYAIAKTVLAVDCALQARGIRSIAAKAAPTAVVARLAGNLGYACHEVE
jgi:hypothetical protein